MTMPRLPLFSQTMNGLSPLVEAGMIKLGNFAWIAKMSIGNKGRISGYGLQVKKFSIKDAIKANQAMQPPVSWSSVVWGNHFLPRYAIILWMAC